MNERDKVLLQREAIKRFVTDDGAYYWTQPSEDRLRRLFPLPPEKVPNVELGVNGLRFRQHPMTGRLQSQYADREWRDEFAHAENEAAVRRVIAEPYRLVSGEDGE